MIPADVIDVKLVKCRIHGRDNRKPPVSPFYARSADKVSRAQAAAQASAARGRSIMARPRTVYFSTDCKKERTTAA